MLHCEHSIASVLAEATVMDVNRQAWSSTTSLLVHPAHLYVGLRSPQYFVERGTPIDIDLIVAGIYRRCFRSESFAAGRVPGT